MLAKLLSFKQVEQNLDKLPVLLLGSIEQHGPFLPIGTDTLIGEAISQELEQRLGEKLLILPILPIGCSKEHLGFAGTLSLEFSTYLQLVKEIISSVFESGFERILLISTHGGNHLIGQLIQADCNYQNKNKKVLYLSPIDQAVDQRSVELFGGSEFHAGSTETSLLAYLYPKLVGFVGKKRNNNFAPDTKEIFTVFTTQEKTKLGIINFSPVLEVDPKKGQQLFKFIVDNLCQKVAAILSS